MTMFHTAPTKSGHRIWTVILYTVRSWTNT